MHRLAFIAILRLPLVADAESPDPGVVYATAAVGVSQARVAGDGYGFLGWDLAIGARVRELWLRAALTKSDFVQGTYGFMYEPRVGIEYRTYDNPRAAAFFGLDAGVLTGSGPHEDAVGDSSLHGVFVMPRGGIEGGFEHVRIRLSLEFVLGYGHQVDVGDGTTAPVDSKGLMRGANFELGVIVR